MTDWHVRTGSDVVAGLDSHPTGGLGEESAREKLAQHGENELTDTEGRGPLTIVWEQLRGALVLLLVVAAGISLILHEYIDAGAIAAIILLNTILGFVQDYRAEKALAALKKMAVPKVRVRRDGRVREISARELVPGDIVLLEVGNLVPADCRLLESANLKLQEAALTGESDAILKSSDPLEEDGDLPLGDRVNMAYMGTVISYGHGVGVVVATGMDTELGKIARSLQTVSSEPTPLQRRLTQMGRTLALVALGIVGVIVVLGLRAGEDWRDMLMIALSMAVAIVPEGLPAVATVALALGARRMFQRQALIRKLPAVETLGSVTVICSDKTGTLTENRMTVTKLDVVDQQLDLTEQPRRDGRQDGRYDEEVVRQVAEHSSLALLLAGAGLCNDAEVEFDGRRHAYQGVGDPTEVALAIAAARTGLPKSQLARLFPRVDELPFDSDRKRMTTIHEIQSNGSDEDATIRRMLAPLSELDHSDRFAITKGAGDALLAVSEYLWQDDEPRPLNESIHAKISEANERMAGEGMRVLGIALRPVEPDMGGEEAERDLIFVGLIGMIDPPRPEVKEAVARCQTAGIRPMMITGDHPLTALHIARQLGIGGDQRVMTGKEIGRMSAADLEPQVEEVSVYARVAPQDKLHIVKALQQRRHVVAMTGDGVNDAPALKQAHIGVAMGQVGTDVSKEASAMVLLDDNFATIVNAVEEGRLVYDNIRKFVKYTMTSNAGEIWVMVLGPLVGMPLPLLPLQILWINLVTDGLPGLALAVERAERDTMRRPPYSSDEHIFGRGMGRDIAWIGLLMGVVSLSLGYWSWLRQPDFREKWGTIVFTVLTLSQMGNALAIRSNRDSVFTIGFFSNRFLIGSVILTFVLQVAVIYWSPLQKVFKTTALSATEFLACLLLSSVVFFAVEAWKLLQRHRRSN